MDRIEQKSELGTALRKAFNFLSLDNWRASPGLIELDDSNDALVLPNTCLLVQIAVRKDNLVYYDQRLFERLDELNKLVLVFHELIYKVATDLGQRNSSLARQANGLLLSRDTFDQLDGYGVYKALRPFGLFSFPAKLGETQLSICHVFEETANGRPKVFSVAREQQLQLNGIDYLLAASNCQVPSVSLDDNGQIVSMLGTFADADAMNSSPGTITLVDQVPTTISFSYKSSFSWKGKRWTDIYRATFAQGQLSSIDGGKRLIETAAGVVSATGTVTLYPDGVSPHRFSAEESWVRSKFGFLRLSGNVELYENGQLKFVESAYSSGRDRLQLSNGSSIRVDETALGFYDNGDIATVAYHSPDFSKLVDLSWNKGAADNLISASFDKGNILKSISFAADGSLLYDRIWRDVGAKTMELNPDGTLSTPLEPITP